MTPSNLFDLYEGALAQHQQFHAKAAEALARLHTTRVALLELLGDATCAALIAGSASPSVPEVLRTWGYHAEVVL